MKSVCSNKDESTIPTKGCIYKANQEMTTKKDAQFSFGECFCAEMMAQMMPQSKGRQEATTCCIEMMAQFGGSQDSGERREMISPMKSVCCGAGQEGDETVSRA